MAANETQFKAELRSDAKVLGMFGVSNSPEFNIGIPDLYFKHKDYTGVYIETKWFKTRPITAKCGLSTMQAKWIRDYRLVNGMAATLIGWKSGPVEWSAGIHFGADAEESVKFQGVVVRKRGEQWRVDLIVAQIEYWHQKQRTRL